MWICDEGLDNVGSVVRTSMIDLLSWGIKEKAANMKRMVRAMAVGVFGVTAAMAAAQGGAVHDPLHIWVGNPDAAKAKAWADAHMTAAQAQIDAMLAVKGGRMTENTLRLFDKALRDVGDEVVQKVSAQATALSLNPDVYHALQAVDPRTADAATRYYLEHA